MPSDTTERDSANATLSADTASIIDVAEYLLSKEGEMSTMKLQKLLYFCQGWNLAWTGHPLFDNEFEAWASGPVVRELFELHKNELSVSPGFFYEKLREQASADAASADPAPADTIGATRS